MRVLRYCFAPEFSVAGRATRAGARLGAAVAALLVAGRVIPRGHAVLRQPSLRVGDVLAAGFDSCPASWRYADRIVLLGAVCIAFIAFALVGLCALLAVLVPAAEAAEAAGATFAPNLLASAFGSPDVFGGASASASSPLHAALYSMLGFYSKSLMVVATFIVVYFVVTVVGESAQTGTPFGRRFNGLWAPLRLVFALGLLVPLGAGLNAAQYLTLYTAKQGSAWASEAWQIFTDTATARADSPAPSVPAVGGVVGAVFMSEVCAAAFNEMRPQQVQLWHDKGGPLFSPVAGSSGGALTDAAQASGAASVVLVWGRVSSQGPRAGLDRVCGSVTVKAASGPLPRWYAGEVLRLADVVRPWAQKLASAYVAGGALYNDAAILDGLPLALGKVAVDSQNRAAAAVAAAYKDNRAATEDLPANLGWIGAGVHYPALAKSARQFMGLVRDAFPVVVVPVTASQFDNENAATGGAESVAVMAAVAAAERVAPPAISAPAAGLAAAPSASPLTLTERPLETVLQFVFGTTRLREMRVNPSLEPMAALAAAGDDLITRALYAFSFGLAAEVGGSFLSGRAVPKWISGAGKVAETLGGFAVSVATVGLVAGLVLLYVLPLLPFVYFFFALLGWIFALAEALLGVPLWCLAHLRIDGDGFAGQAATGGYFLLLELLLRPLLIVLASVVSYLCFWAGAWALSSLFDLATSSAVDAVGVNAPDSSGLDAFVFTIIFAVMAYGVAVASFKLIDKIPNEILRWLGAGVRPFMGGNDAPDLRSTMIAGGAAVGNVSSGLRQVANSMRGRAGSNGGGSARVG